MRIPGDITWKILMWFPIHYFIYIIIYTNIYTRSPAIVAVIADRTTCSILTLFIVIATSRPLNKKIHLLSVRGSNNYCGSASVICSPHTSAVHLQSHRVTVHGTVSLLTNEPCLFVPLSLSPIHCKEKRFFDGFQKGFLLVLRREP